MDYQAIPCEEQGCHVWIDEITITRHEQRLWQVQAAMHTVHHVFDNIAVLSQ